MRPQKPGLRRNHNNPGDVFLKPGVLLPLLFHRRWLPGEQDKDRNAGQASTAQPPRPANLPLRSVCVVQGSLQLLRPALNHARPLEKDRNQVSASSKSFGVTLWTTQREACLEAPKQCSNRLTRPAMKFDS
jgi:hypothetical protein